MPGRAPRRVRNLNKLRSPDSRTCLGYFRGSASEGYPTSATEILYSAEFTLCKGEGLRSEGRGLWSAVVVIVAM
jgi:hypothetical protein